MKKSAVITISIALGLAALLAAAYFAYGLLKDEYETESSSAGTTVLSGSISSGSKSASTTGETAEDFTFYDYNGNEVQLSDYFGKPIVLNFWASWCGPCKSEMPDFQEVYEEYGDQVQFLMVNLTDGSYETEEDAKSLITSKGYTFPVFFDLDQDGAKTYVITSIPTTMIINSGGYIVKTNIGAMEGSTLTGLLDNLLQ